MAGHDDFRDGAHAHGVGADVPEVAVFGRRLIAGAGDGDVDALLEGDSLPGGDLLRLQDEAGIVRTGHVREPRAELVQVRADERVRDQVDVVADDHQVAHVEAEVRAARRVGDEQVLDADADHHPDGEDHQVHRVAFVVVDAALHRDHALPAEGADDEVPLVADGRGHGESGEFAVGDDEGVLDLVGQHAEAAAEDDADHGLPSSHPLDEGVGGGVYGA